MSTEFTPKSIIVENSPDNIKFAGSVQAWVNGEISYQQLMKDYPPHYNSDPGRRLMSLAARNIRQLLSNL